MSLAETRFTVVAGWPDVPASATVTGVPDIPWIGSPFSLCTWQGWLMRFVDRLGKAQRIVIAACGMAATDHLACIDRPVDAGIRQDIATTPEEAPHS